MRIIDLFKNLFFIGLIVLFLSSFFDWYSFSMINSNGETIVKWSYHLFFGWTTPFSNSSVNNEYRPESSLFPIAINIILIGLIIFSVYIVIFKNIENISSEKNKIIYGYGIMALCILILYYISSFPWYLGELYYPAINIEDLESGSTFIYTIELGYILQILAFPMIFAYALYYFMTAFKFEKEESTPERIVHDLVLKVQEELDFDKLIAEEELKSITNNKIKN